MKKTGSRILADGVSVNNNTWETGLANNDLIVGPTGGYIVGYLLLALVEGGIYYTLGGRGRYLKKTGVLVFAMVVGTAALYALGTVWFMAVTHNPLAGALLACVVPFLPGDAAKIIVVALVVPQLERALGHFGMLPKAVNAS